ncbi:hypothetical protein C347_05667 [Cryptococcus neoformans AD2-60a]|nr:hypothetical protein C347_05667 [Cryptococcus neoformans var. grubii AD2-60a]OXC82480.1 hypothetical protein C344_05350 [Cryptococcus neoformans var. grubii AD1-7a]OXH26162.1 hypothetical protein J005_05482 [Cryptococcus neoformans var. grubii]
MSPLPASLEHCLPPLKPESLQCIYHLLSYSPSKVKRRLPLRRCAAVAVILFVGRLGDLYVLLSTRAGNMRTFAHDTALPGGKYEPGDIDAEGTARREAYEEIGLPNDRNKVRKLCILDHFLTGNSLIVTPVILLITDYTLTPLLNPAEVSLLFSMPLASFLHSRPSKIPSFQYSIFHRLALIPPGTIESIPPPPPIAYAEDEGHVSWKEGKFYGYRDVKWGEGMVRMHRFLTGRESNGVKPVYGLTAAILIKTATVAYNQCPDFPVMAPGQRSMEERIEFEIRHIQSPLRRALEAEELCDEWGKNEEVKAKL